MSYNTNDIARGKKRFELRNPHVVLSRDGRLAGVVTGTTRRCTMEGCTGVRIGVRWGDGRITWPCTKGLNATESPHIAKL